MVDVPQLSNQHGRIPDSLSGVCKGVSALNINSDSLAKPTPNLSQLANRRQTFGNAPIWDVSKPGFNASELAEAGLYYKWDDAQGHYRCFKCSLNENSWRFDTDPYVEHRRLSPNCSFIVGLLQKREAEKNSDSANTNSNPTSSHGNSYAFENSTIGSVEAPRSTGLESDGPGGINAFDTSGRREQLRKSIRRLRNTCRNCHQGTIEVLFLPCAHLVACEKCSDSMHDCVTCGKEILGTARVYFS